MKKLLVLFFPLLLFAATNCASVQPINIEPHKSCPLCGMYPARYPQFNCQIVFKDGGYEAFDSAVGLLVYLFFPDNAAMSLKPVAKIYFKDYVKESWLESGRTFFVVGSEVMGPMGVEFLAVDSEEAAEELKELVKGQDITHFKEISRQYMISAAKAGWLHYLANSLVLK